MSLLESQERRSDLKVPFKLNCCRIMMSDFLLLDYGTLILNRVDQGVLFVLSHFCKKTERLFSCRNRAMDPNSQWSVETGITGIAICTKNIFWKSVEQWVCWESVNNIWLIQSCKCVALAYSQMIWIRWPKERTGDNISPIRKTKAWPKYFTRREVCVSTREEKTTNQMPMLSEFKFSYGPWLSIVSQSLIRITRESIRSEQKGSI